ncbi:MAG: hypothetical protein N5P05_004431 (plasmid) [Chroococcopsis gigantea SAG 12.99]|jgi:hypothetical protein|nr:hypothetical protein [Chlorogloea purpurea SAG 13.99]MDV3002776.1 hypothetical protein [Chroococcopsis gigantea SAG 12.99]
MNPEKTDEKMAQVRKRAAYAATRALRLYQGESKTIRFSIKMTPTGKQGLEDVADSLDLSMAELIEQIGRKKLRVEKYENGKTDL